MLKAADSLLTAGISLLKARISVLKAADSLLKAGISLSKAAILVLNAAPAAVMAFLMAGSEEPPRSLSVTMAAVANSA